MPHYRSTLLKSCSCPWLALMLALFPPVSLQGKTQGPGQSWQVQLLAVSLLLMLWWGGMGQPCFAGVPCLL